MKGLVAHVRRRLAEGLDAHESICDELPTFDIEQFELAETSAAIVAELHASAIDEDAAHLLEALASTRP